MRVTTHPKNNIEYWTVKFEKNVSRDKRNINELTAMGWKVYTVWECQLKKNKLMNTATDLLPRLADDLGKAIDEEFSYACINNL